MIVWISAGRGIRYREHESRKHGQRPDRYWCIRYKLRGKDVDEAIGWWSQGASKAKCDEVLAELRQNHRLGQGPQTYKEMRESEQRQEETSIAAEEIPGVTLADIWPDYLAQLRLAASKSTIKTFIGLARIWLQPLMGMALSEISSGDLERQVVAPMIEAGKSAATIELALTTFSSIWGWARQRGLVDGANPKSKAKRPRKDNRRVRYLTPDEAIRLLNDLKCRSMDAHDLALLSLFTGLRLSECLGLTWVDIDFENGLIFVKDGKTSLNRHAYITDEVGEMLRRRGDGKPRHEKVFIGSKCGETGQTARADFRAAVKDLKFNDGLSDRRQMVVFHTLRHTFASWLVQKGQPIYTVSKLLGHRGIKHTERYAHLAPATQRAAVKGLEGALGVAK
ncbi:site-specific integrase [Deltaproteobacteria bacterium OttesenSCG-928-M10]|nr:site-specific integrase [Deltaproteobacteria bacterium OttesenSCG-928-M10]